ncbi:MAG TPA: SDR family oxidoreductase [Acetobacteraceae bacterium]|nr:SDR family oxidoreductase [Acetobacteraceae bacterium]
MARPGRVAIVTGGARGIGRASSLALARHGFAIAVVDVRDEPMARTVEEIRALGVEARGFLADTADHRLAHALARQIAAEWGRIDVLFNNAAMPQTKRILEITEEEWDRETDVNLKGYFNWAQAVAPVMMAQASPGRLGGRMIMTSSVSAHTGPSTHAVSRFAYSASKAGVLGLVRGLARELAPAVAVNAICPGAIDTERTHDTFAPHLERIVATTPLGRVGTPEDIAVVVAFLATMEPCFMTGEVIDVDGGANIN